jgi:hypothetical protein
MNIKSFLIFLLLVLAIIVSGCKKLVTVTLSPSNISQGEDGNDGTNNAIYCTGLNQLGTCKDGGVNSIALGNPVKVGFQNFYDPGTKPAPCWAWADCIWRAYVKFDFNTLPSKDIVAGRFIWNSGVHQHIDGVASNFSQCKLALYTANQQWSKYKITGEKIADIVVNSAIASPDVVQINTKTLLGWAKGQQPNFGFFFVGPNEQVKEKDTESCYVDLSNLKLEITTAVNK